MTTQTTSDLVADLTAALIDGGADVVALALRASVEREGTASLAPALLAAERAIVAGASEGRVTPAAKAIADRLRNVLRSLDPSRTQSPVAAEPAGTIALASLPGDAHDVGRHLWRALLDVNGYTTHDLGLRAPALVAQKAASLAPDALAIYVVDRRGRTAVQSLLAQLLRRNARLPVLLSGPGVDQDFARWVSVPQGGDHYWAGVYYCDDVPEAIQVLKQILLFEPPPPAHSHDHGAADGPDACDTCGDCPLQSDCDLPEAT